MQQARQQQQPYKGAIKGLFGMAPLQNSSNSSKNSSQTPQLQNSLELPTPWSCSANGGGVLEHLFCNSNSTQSCSIRQFQLNSKLAPPGVLEWSSSTQSWSHAKQGLTMRGSGDDAAELWRLAGCFRSSRARIRRPRCPPSLPSPDVIHGGGGGSVCPGAQTAAPAGVWPAAHLAGL